MNELPVGRRVAQWRVRRNLTQQQFADRLGKSKSWVDKVERGVRRLERVSNLREIADALRIDLDVLLPEQPRRSAPARTDLERLRAALARYHLPAAAAPSDPARLRARLEYAEQSYRHARYPPLLAILPDLLDDARAADPGPAADALLVPVYGLVALVLVKLGRVELAWLAADRSIAVARSASDARLVAVASVPLVQALRSAGRWRSALEAALVAAGRVGDPGLRGALLAQAALAAAGRGDGPAARKLLDRAAQAGDGAAVEAAGVVAEAALGEVRAATVRHERLTTGDEWRWLPAEHRAAYLLDVARMHARAGDGLRAGRALLEAERTARGEVHDRPAARDLVAVVARSPAAPPGLTSLAAALRV
ncbi:helix-turn-helix transcriptional regulator [Micromonospora sp. WMMD1128]|uniref:helix-turn-helix domain-containing protein n=1 Tax=Micromonospora sp. WMMD1128 TaxID=3015150 RepID=UPI00248B00A3|nr:helix-turn-helix transcriptional regulator [Micromonospora sp. WMMD1128]WBB71741.1 helix-turn-helix transcriptional regulator [Micromonospora sp. WMMD1128]